jgi:hypothetical protein
MMYHISINYAIGVVMKLWVGFIIVASLSTVSAARNIYNIDYIHPRSEPKGLYIVSFNHDGRYSKYRVYCPNGDVRNITDGRWGRVRKAYQEDRVRFGSRRVVREAVDYVCGY